MTRLIPERWTKGWRGPALAALVAMVAGLPGLIALPLLDREEARTVQASVQMLESRDFVQINFQDRARDGEPVGAHWLQAASAAVFSSAEARSVWPYRLTSLLGAMLAAAACAWGGALLFRPQVAATAGAMLGASFLLSTAAGVATPDALGAGLTTLCLGALARVYGAWITGSGASGGTKAVFWGALAAASLVAGWTPVVVVVLASLILLAWDRKAPWLRTLGWSWGLIILAAITGPWMMAITVATDGGFWSGVGRRPDHGPILGMQTLSSLAFLFPITVLLPAAVALAWRERASPAVRFAVAWLAPAWLLFELAPQRAIHEVLPLYAPVALLAALAWDHGPHRLTRRIGAGLSLLTAAALAGAAFWLWAEYGVGGDLAAAVVCAALYAAAGGFAALGVLRAAEGWNLALAAGLGVAAHAVLFAALLPGLAPLWPSDRVAAILDRSRLDPQSGLIQGPVTVAGFAEPSLIFALGARTEVGDGKAAAQAILEGRPAVVESRAERAFADALAAEGGRAQFVDQVEGVNYSDRQPVVLKIWRSLM